MQLKVRSKICKNNNLCTSKKEYHQLYPISPILSTVMFAARYSKKINYFSLSFFKLDYLNLKINLIWMNSNFSYLQPILMKILKSQKHAGIGCLNPLG